MYTSSEDIEYIKERNSKIIRSKVREIFTPHTPISNIEALKGREKEIRNLFEHLTTPGQHAILFGERGVGKSSLALTVSKELAKETGFRLFRKGCVKDDNFATIFAEPLKSVNVDITSSNSSKKGSGSLNLSFAKVSTETSTEQIGNSILSMSPAFVAEKICDIRALFLIDEFDAILNLEDKYKVAELIKFLSDYNSKFKILIVGIADSATDLTAGHPSLTRCLKEIKLRRMSIPELVTIIKSGATRARLSFTRNAISKIAFVSSGYPYFTHLLALKAAEDAIAEERTLIDINDVVRATSKAIENSEESLKKSYEFSIKFKNRETYERILLAAATCREEGFSLTDVSDKYFIHVKEPIKRTMLTSYINNIVSDDGNKILRRLYKGRYRFSDPRMPSFIKIARAYIINEEEL